MKSEKKIKLKKRKKNQVSPTEPYKSELNSQTHNPRKPYIYIYGILTYSYLNHLSIKYIVIL